MSMEILYSGASILKADTSIEQLELFEQKTSHIMQGTFLDYSVTRPYIVSYSKQGNISSPIITDIVSHHIICIMEGDHTEFVGVYVHENTYDIRECKETIMSLAVTNDEQRYALIHGLTELERTLTF